MKNRNSFKSNKRSQGESQRQLKVSQLINLTLIECLRRGKGLDRWLEGSPLNITRVNVSTDLRIANCYFLPFNTHLTIEQILISLEKSRYAIRQYITDKVQLKYSPEIRFYYDSGFENFNHINNILKKLEIRKSETER